MSKDKKQLELVFLMKVILSFETFEDIVEFIQINKKCQETVHALKVNPSFFNQPSFEKFFKYFTPQTINCNSFQLSNASIFNQVDCIKYPNIDCFFTNSTFTEKQMTFVLDKVTTIQLYSRDNEDNKTMNTTKFMIKYAYMINNLRKIEGSVDNLIKFFKSYTVNGTEMNVNFPKKIIIELYDNVQDEKQYKMVEKKLKTLQKYLRLNDEIEIIVISLLHPFNRKMIQLFNKFSYYYMYLTEKQISEREDGIINKKGVLQLNGTINAKRFEELMRKCYCHELQIDYVTKPQEEWIVPSFIKKIKLHGCSHMPENGDVLIIERLLIQFQSQTLEELELNNCFKITLKLHTKNLKKVILRNCHKLIIEDFDDNPFPNVKELQMTRVTSSAIQINNPIVDKVFLESLQFVLLQGEMRECKELFMSNCAESAIPILQFGNHSIHFESCSNCFFSNTIEKDSFIDHDVGLEIENFEDDESMEEIDEDDEDQDDDNDLEEEEHEEEEDDDNDLDDDDDQEDLEEDNEEEDDEDQDDDNQDEEDFFDLEGEIDENGLPTERFIEFIRKQLQTTKQSKRDKENNNPLSDQISYQDLLYLMSNSLTLPNDHLKETVEEMKKYYTMKPFHAITDRVELQGNKIIRLKPVFEEEFDPIVSSSFFDLFEDMNEKLMKIHQKDGTIVELPHLISYYEITVKGYSLLSFGVCAEIEEYQHGDIHVGWIENSIGYHSDDGYMFNGDGQGKKYGPPYGSDKKGMNVVGCGADLVNKKVFFTFNGKRLNDIDFSMMKTVQLFAIIVVETFDELTINYGDTPFVFDLCDAINKINNKNE